MREEADGGFELVAPAGCLSRAGVVSDATGAHLRDRSSVPRNERRRIGGNFRRRSPGRAWPRAGPVTPSPLRSYAPAAKEMSARMSAPRAAEIKAEALRLMGAGRFAIPSPSCIAGQLLGAQSHPDHGSAGIPCSLDRLREDAIRLVGLLGVPACATQMPSLMLFLRRRLTAADGPLMRPQYRYSAP